MLQTLTRHNLNLADSLNILLRICPNLLSVSPELILNWWCIENLTTQNGTNLLAIYQNRSTKIHKTRMALINRWLTSTGSSLTAVLVALFTATTALSSATSILHAELRPVSRSGNRLAILVYGYCSHTSSSSKAVLEGLQKVHIKYVFKLNFFFCHKKTPLPFTI